jgi:hypothetical protein
MVEGIFICVRALSMATVASESETPGERLKESVAAGESDWWLTESGMRVVSR